MPRPDLSPTRPLSPIRLTLQAEGAGVAVFCIMAYGQMAGSWGLFALLILAPDVFMLGYLIGPRMGALLYNLGHTYLGPLGLSAAGWAFDTPTGVLIALIWGAHIGADRAIGYGLKYAQHFKSTHLGRV